MSKLEKEISLKSRNSIIKKAVLNSVAVTGFLAVSMLAPNALQFLDQIQGKKRKSLWQRMSVDTARRRMIDKGFLEYDGKGFVHLTEKGRLELNRLESNEYKVTIPKKWDGRWRVIIFDIKEERKNLRAKIRRTLVCMGFKRLQDSVWLFPYDCEDLITLLKADFKIGKDLLYMIVEKIENDKSLREWYGLRIEI
jgi:CRISPR/Cas system-associated endoribonuclease Cas2